MIRPHSFPLAAVALAAIACLPLAAGPALAATPLSKTMTPPPHLIKLPNGDYTVPMRELEGSGVHGVMRFHPQGMKTLVTTTVYGNILKQRHAIALHPGSSCSQLGGAQTIPLRPAITGVPSSTLLSVPIGNFTSGNYIAEVRNATEQQQRREACGQL